MAWGIFDGRHIVMMVADKGQDIWAERLILAPEAYERPVPFPGWTLPGVMGGVGVQRMINQQWVMPGQRFLFVGAGPVQVSIATQVLKNGADVVGIADAAPSSLSWRHLYKIWGAWNILWQEVGYSWNIRKRRVPVIHSHAILRADGDGQVERVVTADVDINWHPIPGTERTWEVDTLCVSYGFISSIELAGLAGCKINYVPMWGSWVPEHNSDMRTSVPGVFVAGDGAGLNGAMVAADEGRIAGTNAATELGYGSDKPAHPASSSYRRLRGLSRFRAVLDGICQFRPGLYDIIDDDTLLCRCEEVTYKDVKKAIADGAEDLNQVRSWAGAGMGMCQGRFCQINLAHLLAAARGISVEMLRTFTVRPPVKPVPMNVFTREGD
jgi:bacterioferritin-associated ferredoxin